MSAEIKVSIVVPCKNEERHIAGLIERIQGQVGIGSAFAIELLLVDGRSKDKTREIIEAAAAVHRNIKIIDNPAQVTPVAFNLGIKAASGRYICILGAHSRISPDYILSALAAIQETGADNVGGPWKAIGEGYWGAAISVAFQSPFSSGGAKSHDLAYQGFVDSVWGGFYKREVFDRIGLFDPVLVRNQDDELNFRLVMAGGKIYQTPKINYEYVCRNSLSGLWNQYYQYGYYKIYILRKHGRVASFRHLVPSVFVLALVFSGVGAALSAAFLAFFAAIVCTYVLLLVLASCVSCFTADRIRYLPVMPVVLATFHLAYGIGFVHGAGAFLSTRAHVR